MCVGYGVWGVCEGYVVCVCCVSGEGLVQVLVVWVEMEYRARTHLYDGDAQYEW